MTSYKAGYNTAKYLTAYLLLPVFVILMAFGLGNFFAFIVKNFLQ